VPMIDQPHSSWAEVYDIAYQRSFGDFYARLTDATVDLIAKRVQLPAKIVDFGAGTGRLSIPLSRKGFDVTAVEPCENMLNQLKRKDVAGLVTVACSKMENFRGEVHFDAALCVFTVILYLLEETALRRSFEAANASLKPGGILLLDIPSEAIFSGYSRRDAIFERCVTVTHNSESIYTYREELVVKNDDGEPTRYEDEFRIRHWHSEQVIRVLQDTGFSLLEDLSALFFGAGSNYYILKKAEQGAAPDGNSAALHCRR